MSNRTESQRPFLAAAALLFAASIAATIAACRAMAAMDDMPMPGGWTLSMMWMRMPGQTWPGIAAAWLGMWQTMTVAMMLPVLLPPLQRYRARLGRVPARRIDALTAGVALAYFTVWALLGAGVFALGAGLAACVLESAALARAMPLAIGATVLAAGLLQFSTWKRRRLACCRDACVAGRVCSGRTGATEADVASAGHAWRFGVRLGVDCVQCCAGPTAVLLAAGMMDLRAMALVTAAICLERLAPGGERVASQIGACAVAAGCLLLLRAALT